MANDQALNKVRLEIWGDRAVFTSPILKTERYSYDVITPSAARNILQQIYWHPSMQYQINAITVYNEVRRMAITRNELDFRINPNNAMRMFQQVIDTGMATPICVSARQTRQQRSTSMLMDVHYAIEATILPSKWNKTGEPFDLKKIRAIFDRRANRGQCFSTPYMGIREYPANFAPERFETPKKSFYDGMTVDLGIMLFDVDFDYEPGERPYFYHPRMVNGRIEVPTQKEVMGDACRCIE